MLTRSVLVLALVPVTPAFAAPLCKYEIEVLAPSLPDYSYCFATGLSDKGHVVGTCVQDEGEERRAFRYRAGVTTSVGVLPGFNQGHGAAVNDHGHVVGSSSLSFDPTYNDAFVWRDGVMEDIELWASFPMGDTFATDLNDAGEIVGSDDYDLAVYWLEGQDPIYLPGEIPTHASAINDAGQIVGSAWVGAQRHLVRWDDLTLVDLGTLPGGHAEGTDIADNGFIAGTGSTAQGVRGLFYSPSDPGLEVIGTLGGPHSYAHGVSSDGLVVGSTSTAAGASKGFVWRKGQLFDLDQLLHDNPPADPWRVQSARTINDQGEILVLAYNSTAAASLILRPRSCAVSASLACCPF